MFGALLAAVYRGFPGGFAAARCFDQAAVDDEVLQIQSDDPVVGLQADLLQFAEDPWGDPFVAAPSDGGGRAGRVADFLIGSAQDEDLDEFIEDDPVADPWLVAAQRVGAWRLGDQCLELAPEGLDDGRW